MCFVLWHWKKITNEEFIRRAQHLHPNTYDYSKVNYRNYHSKVVVTCLSYEDFEQTPANHLKPCGCSKCGDMKTSEKLSLTKEQFIEKARKVHGNN